jgi:hypothetical protein
MPLFNPSGGGGVTDHGALTGLADDDHPQYLTAAEGNAAYDALGAASSAVSAHEAAGDPHPGYLTTAEGNAAYEAAGAVAAHAAAADPHPTYLTAAEGNAAYSATGHTHTQVQSHNSPDTDTATTALHHTLGVGANQAAAGNHTHTAGNLDSLSDVVITSPTTDQVIKFNGTNWVNGTDATSSGAGVTVLASDVTNNNAVANTIADVTGLSFAVTSGLRYKFRFVIFYTAAASTTGSRWTINGPTTTLLRYRSAYSLTATSRTFNEAVAAYNTPAACNATSVATNQNMAVIEGSITPSANGTVIARFASEVANSAIVAKAGSYVEYSTY